MSKIIKETKCICNSCGNIWFFGKQEAMENAANALSNAGKGMMCCTGCLPAIFIKDKNIIDLGKCPKCGSRNNKKGNYSPLICSSNGNGIQIRGFNGLEHR
jgi:hypothetical protein